MIDAPKRDPYPFAVGAMWLLLPATALHFWAAWDRLPARVATHFDDRWRADGWSDRGDALTFALGMLAVTLVVLTPACALVRLRKPAQAWAVLVVAWLAAGLIAWASNDIVSRNVG